MASDSELQCIRDTVNRSPAVIFSKSYCPYCNRAKKKLQDLKINFVAIEVNLDKNSTRPCRCAFFAEESESFFEHIY